MKRYINIPMGLISFILCLSGCATCPSAMLTVPVKEPVAVSCDAEQVPEPDWHIDRLPPNATVTAKIKAVLADLELSRGYISELQAELIACS